MLVCYSKHNHRLFEQLKERGHDWRERAREKDIRRLREALALLFSADEAEEMTEKGRLRPSDADAPRGNPAEIPLFLKLLLSRTPRRNTNMPRCSRQALLSGPAHKHAT